VAARESPPDACAIVMDPLGPTSGGRCVSHGTSARDA
jgi:hypothetical protein